MRLRLHIVTRIMLINATSKLDTECENRSMIFSTILARALFYARRRARSDYSIVLSDRRKTTVLPILHKYVSSLMYRKKFVKKENIFVCRIIQCSK